MSKNQSTGASLGGPPSGASLGGPGTTVTAKANAKKNNKKKPAKAQATPGTTVGGTGASLGGPPPNGASLGAPPSGSSLGAPPSGASLGAPPSGSSLGAPPSGSSLGAPPSGSSLGAPPSGSSLGAPPSGSSLGAPPSGSSLGAPPSGAALGVPPSGAGLGAPPSSGAALGSPEASLGSPTESAASKKKKKKKKEPAKPAAPVKKKKQDLEREKRVALIKQQQEEQRLREEEEKRQREEEERRRIEQEKEEARLAEEKRKRNILKRQKRKESEAKKKLELARARLAPGTRQPPTKTTSPPTAKPTTEPESTSQQEKQLQQKEEADSDSEKDWQDLYSSDEEDKEDKVDKEVKQVEEKKEEVSAPEFRSPICCVLGHVDTGKTLLLDKIRRSNVQRGEAGGITQQIGATYLPIDTINNLTATLRETVNVEFLVPGLLVIDTPGHESFTNLRSRGSSLCDIAILVVDINHGIEQQTEESLKLLKKRQTPFVVALNKIDRIYEWQPNEGSDIRSTLSKQRESVRSTFKTMVSDTKILFAERGFNAELYYENKDFRNNLSLVPTSAKSGEGIPDLLVLLIQLTQRMMKAKLYISPQLKCTVLEIKQVEGLGMTADVIVSDGMLHEGQQIVLCGINGPIVTNIRALLTPPPLREIRINAGKGNPYEHRKTVKAAMGVKIVAHDLNEVVAGSQLFVVDDENTLEDLKEEVQSDLKNLQRAVSTGGRGVYVQSSTLGSLEALLSFLKESKIPVSGVGIGPIHKRDVTRASVMLEHEKKYAVILAFDIKIEKSAQELADRVGVKIFSADIIYHLKDMFVAYLEKLEEERRRQYAAEAVWPVVMEILPEHIFNKRDPILLGVKILEGSLRINTPICAISPDGTKILYVGKVTGIEENKINKDVVEAGASAAIKITPVEKVYCYDRHFDFQYMLLSRITRESIDRLKEFFKKEITKTDVRLLKRMKEIYKIED